MLKYVDVKETFSEVPDEISLCISLSNCPLQCEGCHSAYLRQDIGEPINSLVLTEILKRHKGITCVCLFGGESCLYNLEELFRWLKENTDLKTCWYTGLDNIPSANALRLTKYCDYVKYGPYIKERGPLTSKTTNQRFVQRIDGMWKDITNKFWKNESKD